MIASERTDYNRYFQYIKTEWMRQICGIQWSSIGVVFCFKLIGCIRCLLWCMSYIIICSTWTASINKTLLALTHLKYIFYMNTHTFFFNNSGEWLISLYRNNVWFSSLKCNKSHCMCAFAYSMYSICQQSFKL